MPQKVGASFPQMFKSPHNAETLKSLFSNTSQNAEGSEVSPYTPQAPQNADVLHLQGQNGQDGMTTNSLANGCRSLDISNIVAGMSEMNVKLGVDCEKERMLQVEVPYRTRSQKLLCTFMLMGICSVVGPATGCSLIPYSEKDCGNMVTCVYCDKG